jgi:UDP-N-acetylmuramoyl-L-alanyl-D-glutamate--2,6-diaminopimelate ligase
MNAPRALADLLRAADLPVPEGLPEIPLRGLCLDSRKAKAGDLFLALRGGKQDGSAFAADAAQRGAAAVLAEGESGPPEEPHGAPLLRFPDLRLRVGTLFDAWHGFPSRRLEAFAVTGTNGKSTTARLMTSVLRAAGRKVISLGTVRYELEDEVLGSDLTTPSPDVFFELLARGVAKGCDALAMEASSHALSQDRIRGVKFRRAVFTNLTQDHLDFHEGFEDYFAAKKKLFTEYLAPDGLGVLNLDAPYGARLLAEWGGPHVTFSRAETSGGKSADVTLVSQDLSLEGSRLQMSHRGRTFEIRSRLVGTLNVENLLAAAAFGVSLELPPEILAAGMAEVTVPGRNEVLALPVPGAFAVVDYAHTPDALERVLGSLRPLTAGKLWCLFGCGGDRDRGKRPLMGGIAENLSDQIVITSDNPRSEPPEAILEEIRAGMRHPEDARLEPDRKAAIRSALDALQPGDCLLVAGKGHEDYQILGSERRHFSDQEEIGAWARERGGLGWI